MDLGQMTVIPLPLKSGSKNGGSELIRSNSQSRVYYANGGSGGGALGTGPASISRDGGMKMNGGGVEMTNGTTNGTASPKHNGMPKTVTVAKTVGAGTNGAVTTTRSKNTAAADTPIPPTSASSRVPPGTLGVSNGVGASAPSASRTMTHGGGGYAPLINGTGHGSPVRTPVKSGSFYPVNKAPQPSSPLKSNPANSDPATNGYTPVVEKFHINEMVRTSDSSEEVKGKDSEELPFFAGKTDLLKTEELQEKIISSKGTVRGVKNRVKAGIATFLEHQHGTVQKNYAALEKGQVVLYATSMMIVRETYERCQAVRRMLATHMLAYEERDICMSRENQRQLADRLGLDPNAPNIDVPHVFADGQHLGGAEELEKMNENGELRKVFKKFKKVQAVSACGKCGGYLWVPCGDCHGSKKSLHRNHFTAEFCALRCIACDENGLVRCDLCESERKS